jgi:hypothetical protein
VSDGRSILKVLGEKCGNVLVENLNERNHLADLGVHVKVIYDVSVRARLPWFRIHTSSF